MSGYNINSIVLQFVLQLSRADLSLSSEIRSGDGGPNPAIEGGSSELKVECPFLFIQFFLHGSQPQNVLTDLNTQITSCVFLNIRNQESFLCACEAEHCISMFFWTGLTWIATLKSKGHLGKGSQLLATWGQRGGINFSPNPT